MQSDPVLWSNTPERVARVKGWGAALSSDHTKRTGSPTIATVPKAHHIV